MQAVLDEGEHDGLAYVDSKEQASQSAKLGYPEVAKDMAPSAALAPAIKCLQKFAQKLEAALNDLPQEGSQPPPESEKKNGPSKPLS